MPRKSKKARKCQVSQSAVVFPSLVSHTGADTVATAGKKLGIAIQKGRMEKKMNQKDLAQAINEKASVINQYETGKAIPNPAIINKMERVLGVKLPRPKKK